MKDSDLRYPIGPYEADKSPSVDKLKSWIADIQAFPNELKKVLSNLPAGALNWPYRPDGWTIKQVVHHCGDSHMNALIRFKLALTENTPTIRPYFEDRWAKLDDYDLLDYQSSLKLLELLHQRWVILINSLPEEQLHAEYFHPEMDARVNLKEAIGNYSWHCRHHLAHVINALDSQGKYCS